MIGSPRIPLRRLADLCRRLAITIAAGIDIRTVWLREVERGSGVARRQAQSVLDALQAGKSLADGLAATGDYFPRLFREMAGVGEETGHLPEVFRHLADHYDMQLVLRRSFLQAITWPLFQLGVTATIIGLLIWVMGVVGRITGMTIDPLGLGLVGERGLAIYLAFLAGVTAVIGLAVYGMRRGWGWTRPVQRVVDYVPGVGTTLHWLALSRLAWAMSIALDSEMNIRRGLRLSLQSTQYARFLAAVPTIDEALAANHSLLESLSAARCFPKDFLDRLHAAEESGKIPESMSHLAQQYQDRAQAALSTLTMFAGFAIWAVIATIIIVLIFRLFFFYIGQIDALTK